MTAIYQSRERAAEAAERMKIYAQPQRLMILSYLLTGEHTVGEIEAATAIGQPALSQQLAELRRAELVETRRAAKQVYYQLADPRVALCVKCVEAIFSGADPEGALAEMLRAPSAESALASRAGAASFAKILG
jgi:DNA-binding transcriptional ArsR family regulator